MTGLTAAGLGLAALLGWSAVILSVEGRRTPSGGHPGRSETVHHVAHVVKDKVEGQCERGRVAAMLRGIQDVQNNALYENLV